MPTTCSRGVSTDEEIKHKQTELNLESPPSTTSSTPSVDPIANEPMLSRNSMLFSLIACGGTGSFRKAVLPPCTAGRKSCSGAATSLHKGVVCREAKMAAETEEEERLMINYMSENPRFGNSQAEDKEYFSGSIVDSITNHSANQPVLKKSSSFNQERCAKAGLGVGGEEAEEEVKEEKGLRGKCIPRKNKSSSNTKKKPSFSHT